MRYFVVPIWRLCGMAGLTLAFAVFLCVGILTFSTAGVGKIATRALRPLPKD